MLIGVRRCASLLLALAGCGAPEPALDDLALISGSARLVVRARPFSLELSRGDRLLARTVTPAIELGRLAAPDRRYYPDPFSDENGVSYTPLERVVAVLREGSAVRLSFAGDAARGATLTLAPEEDGAFSIRARGGDGVVHVRVNFAAGAREHYYGLGEYFDTPDHRGRRRDVRFALDLGIESGYNEAHVPVPAFVSTSGYGMFLDSREPLAADFASRDEVVHLTLVAENLDGHLFAAATPVEAMARLQRFAGLPPLWPPWMFAPQQWRNDDPVTCSVPCSQGCKATRTGADIVLDDARAMRRLKLPAGVLWIDAPWMTAFNDFQFNPIQFPDAKGLIRTLNGLGFEVAVWAAPFINQSDDRAVQCGMLPPPAGGLYDEARRKGYFITAANGEPALIPWRGSTGAMIDFTNPDASAFWRSLVKRTTDLGVRGYKLDWDEYVVAAVEQQRLDLRFRDGSTPATQHALQHELFHKAHHDALVEAGGPGFIIARSGTASDAKYAAAIWPGDLCNNFLTHRAPPAPGIEGSKPHVGGLPAAVSAAISLAASGHPHFGSDLGGFRHGRPTKEALARWIEFGALSTIMQLGGGGEHHNPWDFQGTGFDQELLDIYRRYARLHISLFPYLYAYVKRNSSDGTPILRPLGLSWPGEAGLQDERGEYMFGDDLLVAPVLAEGARRRTVVLPPGRWIDYASARVHQGPAESVVDAPLDALPLFVREGAILPLLPDDVDTLGGASEPGVTTLAARAGELWLRIYPLAAESRRFALADGTTFTAAALPAGLDLSISSPPLRRRYSALVQWSLLGQPPPTRITRAGGSVLPFAPSRAAFEAMKEGAYFDPQAGSLALRVEAAAEQLAIR